MSNIGYNDWNLTGAGGTCWVVYKDKLYREFQYKLPKNNEAEYDKLKKMAVNIAKQLENIKK